MRDSSASKKTQWRPLVAIRDLTKDFGGVHALRGVSLTVSEGELVGLVGPNGSGKTTLVNLISGALLPSSGVIELNGRDIVGLPPHQVAHLGIARTHQIPRPFATLTVRDNVAIAIMFGRDPQGLAHSREAATEYLALVGLTHLEAELPGHVNLHERQLLEMARAMASEPKVLMLDEPTAGMHPRETQEVTELTGKLRDERGYTILLIEHDMRVVKGVSDRVVALDYGRKIAEGTYEEVAHDERVIEAYLGRKEAVG